MDVHPRILVAFQAYCPGADKRRNSKDEGYVRARKLELERRRQMQIALEGKKTNPSRKLEVRKTKTIETQKLKVSSFVSAGTVYAFTVYDYTRVVARPRPGPGGPPKYRGRFGGGREAPPEW